MKKIKLLILVSILLLSINVPGLETVKSGPDSPTLERGQRTYAFTNGRWFDGETFEPRTVYVKDGLLTFQRPSSVDETIDLQGKFVVPPFGEAHNHNIDGFRPEIIPRYLKAGIFYVKNPNGLPRFVASVRDKVNLPRSVDAVFSHGGLTSSGGHPTGFYRRNLSRDIFREEDGEGGFFFTIDTEKDLIQKWPAIESVSRGFIKTYLLYSEEYDKRRSNPEYDAWYGLDPSLLPLIVERAHRARLRVSVHVETATDFHYAVQAGVDEINHMPGFRPDRTRDLSGYRNLASYRIADEDAHLAGEKGIFVVTTLGNSISRLKDAEGVGPAKEKIFNLLALHRENLQHLHRNGVRIAIGTDLYRRTSAFEALELYHLKAFTNLALLKIWCENTPITIFPNRKIGKLEEGYEASFLVLRGNPLDDFENVQQIDLWVKQGQILSMAD